MSLKLYKPGTRKGNKTFVAYGWWNGKPVEKSLGTRDPDEAETKFLELQLTLRKQRPVGEELTYADADALYREAKQIGQDKTLDVIKAAIDNRAAASITAVDLIHLAVRLYPKAKNATRNRMVIVPAAAVLHTAAHEGKIPWIKVTKLKEEAPQAKAITEDQAKALISLAPGMKGVFLEFLFLHGWRIGEALSLRWQDIDLEAGTVHRHIGKTNEWQILPLHETMVHRLSQSVPSDHRVGRVFSWGSRSNVNRWLKPICKKLGIHFTPHMARHSFATWRVNDGVPLNELMEAGGWKDVKSVQRYGRLGREAVRNVIERKSRGITGK